MTRFATLTVIGRDRTGVVARITSFLFEQKANIEALEEQVTRGQFSMTLQASWQSKQLLTDAVRAGLNQLAKSLGMEITLRFTEPRRRQRAAIFVTRESHCLEGLMEHFKRGKLPADPAVVLSNKRDLQPIVEKHGVPYVCVPWNERADAERSALEVLSREEVDFVILARFMKILSPNFVWRYKNKIVNIHPSLLPSFPG